MAQPITPSGASATVLWDRSDLFAKEGIRVRLSRPKSNDGLAVEFSAPKDFVKPDLIVYWVGGNSKITETLPDNAILLGSFSAGPLVLPTPATTEEGHFLLYSLADHEIIAGSKTLHVP